MSTVSTSRTSPVYWSHDGVATTDRGRPRPGPGPPSIAWRILATLRQFVKKLSTNRDDFADALAAGVSDRPLGERGQFDAEPT